MTDEVIVFLGPSLGLDEARGILDATYLPPVKMGDVQSALARRPRVLVIIDGYFERVPAVWHKEILFALHQRVRVVGASSMGALRAAELHTFGMEGIGAIFRAFRDGELTADDEVALVHGTAEDGYRALSEALVNLRDGLALAEARGIVTADERAKLVERARSTFYPERSWVRVYDEARAFGVPEARLERLRALVAEEKPNAKRRDAIEALAHVAGTRERPAVTASFDFEPTEFWHRLVTTTRREGTGLALADVLDEARLTVDDWRKLRDRALLAVLVEAEAQRAGLHVTPEQLSAAATRFRFRNGLASADATRGWLADNGLSETDFAALCRFEVAVDELCNRQGHTLEDAIVAELKRAGEFGRLVAAGEDKRRALIARGTPNPSMEEARVDVRGLLAWYKERFRPLRGGLEAHAKERGFRDTAAFLRAAVRAYAAETARREST